MVLMYYWSIGLYSSYMAWVDKMGICILILRMSIFVLVIQLCSNHFICAYSGAWTIWMHLQAWFYIFLVCTEPCKGPWQAYKQASKQTDFTVDLIWWGLLRLTPISSCWISKMYYTIVLNMHTIVLYTW